MKVGQLDGLRVWTPYCLTTNTASSWESKSSLLLHVTHRFHLLNLSSYKWACGSSSHSPVLVESYDSQALLKCLLLQTLMTFVVLAAGQWTSDDGRAHGGGRFFHTLCK